MFNPFSVLSPAWQTKPVLVAVATLEALLSINVSLHHGIFCSDTPTAILSEMYGKCTGGPQAHSSNVNTNNCVNRPLYNRIITSAARTLIFIIFSTNLYNQRLILCSRFDVWALKCWTIPCAENEAVTKFHFEFQMGGNCRRYY